MSVIIVDYGIGNILSVQRALEHFGANIELTSEPEKIEKAERLILPGVGAFKDGMSGLRERGLIEPIKAFSEKGRPFLGICLGMQMMMDSSEEFGSHGGLGIIPGKVSPIPATSIDGQPHKIPHVGWNALRYPEARAATLNEARIKWDSGILKGIAEGIETYFVHSFTAVPANAGHRLADAYYDGRLISAAIARDHLYGTQFHPEKSGTAGLTMIKNFLEI